MSEITVKLPDVGEGIAEAELVEWHVKVGDLVREDDILAAVMTDKATVEIPTPCAGKVLWTCGDVGDKVAVGSGLVRLGDVGTDAAPASTTPAPDNPRDAQPPSAPTHAPSVHHVRAESLSHSTAAEIASSPPERAGSSARPLAAPAVRQRARELGIDLRSIAGSGPSGRILHTDLERYTSAVRTPARSPDRDRITEIKIVGLRRKIAEKTAISNSRIPHITIIEEVDVTALEELRANLNKHPRGGARLTMLPFIMRAMVTALIEHPELNALYDDEAGTIRRYAAINIGVATQTPNGLVVPVLQHAEALNVWECASKIERLATRARDGTATREELGGSTITITSLGPLGAIATTPLINHPEVAIVGVNRMAIRPLWNGSAFMPRKMMNLSSSFDHRVIDGFNAAVFVQRLKELLEMPALIFLEPHAPYP